MASKMTEKGSFLWKINYILIPLEEVSRISLRTIINTDFSHISSIDEFNKDFIVYDTVLRDFGISFKWK